MIKSGTRYKIFLAKFSCIIIFICCWSIPALQAQQINFNEHIAPIIHVNCTPCHRPGEIGPFSLITYQDVAKRAKFIRHVTQTRYMPPWKADPAFQTYQNERLLTQQEIDLIAQWVDQGVPEGKKRKRPEPPVFEENSQLLMEPDLVLRMPRPFDIPGNGTEEFRYFCLPTHLKEDVYLKAIEFRPDKLSQVHHSRIMVDTTNKIRGIDGMSETNPQLARFQQIPLADEFLYGWVPGNLPVIYPEGTGKPLKKNSDLILNIHYAPSAVAMQDQSSILLYFTKEPIEKEVQTMTLRETDITNQPFVIPADTVMTFYMRSSPLPEDIQLISVLPHMHTVGRSFRAFAITPDGDVVPLVKVNDWDFNWQSTYVFKEILDVPKGSVIYAEATYDNTARNPGNPHVPPQDITYGWNTTDEMMNLIIYYLQTDRNLANKNMNGERDKR